MAKTQTKVKSIKKTTKKKLKMPRSAKKVQAKAKSAKLKQVEGATLAEGAKKPRPQLVRETYFAKWGEVEPKWLVVDAADQALGRLSSEVAKILMGKHKPEYTRHSDTGDFVIVINAAQVRLTGNKRSQKVYQYHTGFAGGIKTLQADDILKSDNPGRVIEWAVYGMIPKGAMGRRWLSRLKVFAGAEHNHSAQLPQPYKLSNLM